MNMPSRMPELARFMLCNVLAIIAKPLILHDTGTDILDTL